MLLCFLNKANIAKISSIAAHEAKIHGFLTLIGWMAGAGHPTSGEGAYSIRDRLRSLL